MRLHEHRRRRGSVLVTYAMLFFALCGVAALVIDLGYARLTQSEMQSAVDTAAIEGLRNRDATTGEPDRQLAADLVSVAFDDDLDATNGDPMQFGAGPVFTLGPGITDMNANQLLGIDPRRVYKPDGINFPRLQPNADNEAHGDLVTGVVLTDQPADETGTYERSDFMPGSNGNAFLVRMRRTNDFSGLDNVSGVSTAGPTLPLLFGRGTTIHGGDPNAGYSVRHHGLTIRATAIAQAVPAKTVGPVRFAAAQPDANVEGLTPFALSRSFWVGMGTNPVELTIDANGVLTSGGNTAGQVIDATRALTVAQRLTDRAATTAAFSPGAPVELACLVPIYDTVPNQGEWFIGFGVVNVTSTSPLTIQRRVGGTAFATDSPFRAGKPFRNVSGSLLQTTNSAIPDGAPLDAVFALNRGLATDPATASLVITAPVLVR